MSKRALPAHRATRGAGYDPGSTSRRRCRSGNDAGRGFLPHAFAMARAWCTGHCAMLMRHFPARTYALASALCGFPGQRCAPRCREAGGAQFGSCRIRRPGPVQAGHAPSRSRCHHASRTPLSDGGAQPQGAESSTHSKLIVPESYFSGCTSGGAACRAASARRAHTCETPGPGSGAEPLAPGGTGAPPRPHAVRPVVTPDAT
jgi:hypothetical protein